MIDHVYLFVFICTWFIFRRVTFLLNHHFYPRRRRSRVRYHSVNMNVTAQQILGHITELETAICDGLRAGNIKDVMKAQKPATVRARLPFGR